MTKPCKALARPSSVRVLGRNYAISYVPPSLLSNAAMGLTMNELQRITVEDGQTPIEEADTVFHETLHALCATLHLGLEHDEEERIVATLATGIVGMLQDNPEYAQWLIADKSKPQDGIS